ncbi:MAG: ribbon-helix-helix protein, CopG family [Gemmatimonadaceae bacterium]|jgi:predicted transcriptional regulator|nr:ribbon-helix-helix protein, CopG family [Gemmatimonadaceae bacterium]
MKIAISLPDDLFERADALAEALGVSRSALYAEAMAEYLTRRSAHETTARLDAVYATEDSAISPSVRRAQQRALAEDSW